MLSPAYRLRVKLGADDVTGGLVGDAVDVVARVTNATEDAGASADADGGYAQPCAASSGAPRARASSARAAARRATSSSSRTARRAR